MRALPAPDVTHRARGVIVIGGSVTDALTARRRPRADPGKNAPPSLILLNNVSAPEIQRRESCKKRHRYPHHQAVAYSVFCLIHFS